ncbi:hypothetical protein MIR68_005376 [Amoeboaphelidium protococcarum]|nr:hypothetical protein MIR68_005376 [Amoeboaphelidium protococcarum]
MTIQRVEASLDNVKILVMALKPLQSEVVTCIASESGLKFIAQVTSSLQACSFIERKLFGEFNLNGQQNQQPADDVSVTFNLTQMLDCLTLFSKQVSSSSYSLQKNDHPRSAIGGDSALNIIIEEDHLDLIVLDDSGCLTTVCKFATYSNEQMSRFAFDSHPTVCRVILKAQWLKEALREMQNAKFVRFETRAVDPVISVSGQSNVDDAKVIMDFEKNVIEFYTCQVPSINSYLPSFIPLCLNALNFAFKVAIRINAIGVMSLQLMIPYHDQNLFVEYCMPPLVEEES